MRRCGCAGRYPVLAARKDHAVENFAAVFVPLIYTETSKPRRSRDGDKRTSPPFPFFVRFYDQQVFFKLWSARRDVTTCASYPRSCERCLSVIITVLLSVPAYTCTIGSGLCTPPIGEHAPELAIKLASPWQFCDFSRDQALCNGSREGNERSRLRDLEECLRNSLNSRLRISILLHHANLHGLRWISRFPISVTVSDLRLFSRFMILQRRSSSHYSALKPVIKHPPSRIPRIASRSSWRYDCFVLTKPGN